MRGCKFYFLVEEDGEVIIATKEAMLYSLVFTINWGYKLKILKSKGLLWLNVAPRK